MWRRFRWSAFILALVAALFAFRSPAEKYFEIAKSIDIFATLFKEVNTYYVDDVEPQDLIKKSIEGMLESLDPYTDYIAEDQIESFRISTTGQYAGIGALIGVINKKIVITHPYKNYPAYRGGIKVGDQIISIDGKNVSNKSTSEISAMLKGQPRTEVTLTVKRLGTKEPIVFKLKREKIQISNITYYGLVDQEVGYIKLEDFTVGASREVAEAVSDLKDQGAKKLIIDLRDNPGGLLHEAVNIVSLFIPRGKEVVSTKGKVAEWNKTYHTLNNPIDTDIPLAVLVSEGSASASEIVAGALQDYDRAILIGKKTFGKGLVQTTRPLAYNAQLKVTTAKYFIPSGRCIQALDYSHRKADGSVDRFADSLRVEYKTSHGRSVFNGGGLDPDIKVNSEEALTITTALNSAGYVFEFSSLYCSENSKPDLKSFSLSDRDYDRFLKFLSERKFQYVTPFEHQAHELIAKAKSDGVYDEFESTLMELNTKIEESKATDLVEYKPQIKRLLEQQIAFNYNLSEGQAELTLKRDEVVIAARKILNEGETYNNILSTIGWH